MGTAAGDDTITLTTRGKVVVATIKGGSFHEEKQILATLERLGQIIDSRKNVKMVVDLETVEYLSSAGLGRLVALLKKAMAGGGKVHLANLQSEIQELFDVMRLTQIFSIYPDVDTAAEAFPAD
ncbi:MAG: STAS domain-containing protein [Planctomycetes bacterium]|nr:STAS domain-containing protein [Planctomycetota bacterium]